jgi:hypothetical protein
VLRRHTLFAWKITMMTKNLGILAAIVATSSLLLDTNEAEAHGRRHCRQHSGSYTQTSQYVNYPVNRVYMVANPGYRVTTISPYPSYSVGYGNLGGYGYRYPSQYGCRRNYRGYGYPFIGGTSIGIGCFGNRGYRGFRY